MRNIFINQSDEGIKTLVNSIEKLRTSLTKLKKDIKKCKLNDEIYFTDSELSDQLKVSRRTLLEWRTNKIISYIHLGGKILYKQSDVLSMLEKHHYKAEE